MASTLEGGDTIPPYDQCLVTPYQNIAERVGLAATIWSITAEQGFNLFQSVPLLACDRGDFFEILPSGVPVAIQPVEERVPEHLRL